MQIESEKDDDSYYGCAMTDNTEADEKRASTAEAGNH